MLHFTLKGNERTQIVLRVINEQNPQTVKQLVAILKDDLDLEEDKILDLVLKLQAEGKIRLTNKSLKSRDVISYLRAGESFWYWIVIAAEMLTTIMVFAISELSYPWFYVRNFLGVLFVLFLPGYAFTRVFFPLNMTNKSSTIVLKRIWRIALSIGMSLALVPLIGLFLYYSPLGLDLTTIMLALFAITLIFASVALAREYQLKDNNSN